MAKFLMSINEEEGTINQMSKTLNASKGDVVILALNTLFYILEQRKAGSHLNCIKGGDDKTADILTEATAGEVKFKLNA